MSAPAPEPTNLFYRSVYDNATASAINTLTVLGETNVAVDSDQEIVVHVSLAALKNSLLYDSAWTRPANDVLDNANLPTVTFDLAKLVDAMAVDTAATPRTAEGRFLAKYDTGLNAVFNDDAGSEKQAMQRFVMEATPMANSQIETIPFEAIIKVQPGGIGATPLSGLPVTAATNVRDSDVMNLFEQALAAGKLGVEVPGTGGTGKCDNFVAGDSITIYVKYAVTRTTKLELDAANATAGVPKFILADGTLVTTAGLEEVGEPTPKTIAYKFLASPPSS